MSRCVGTVVDISNVGLVTDDNSTGAVVDANPAGTVTGLYNYGAVNDQILFTGSIAEGCAVGYDPSPYVIGGWTGNKDCL